MIPSDESLITSENSEPTPKLRKKTKPNMKRMNIRVDDVNESTKTWLANQKNVSASIRLLIDQASRQSVNDYISYCAGLVGPPNQQHETVMFNNRATELEFPELIDTKEMPQSVQVEPDLDLLDEDDNDELQSDYVLLADKSLDGLNNQLNKYVEDGYTLKGIQGILEESAFANSPIVYLATLERLIERKNNNETI